MTEEPEAIPPGAKPVEDLSYTEASRELDSIVDFFEQRDVDVDELVSRLERATALVEELDRRLRHTRAQVEELVPRLEAATAERAPTRLEEEGGEGEEDASAVGERGDAYDDPTDDGTGHRGRRDGSPGATPGLF
jgi:exodeoxyribonuclease VII small subunit